MGIGAEHWEDNDGNKFSSDDENICSLDEKNYAIITVKDIEPNLFQQFQKQLQKGFCIHQNGSRGVKNFKKYSSEIKISLKVRLIGEKIQNKNDKTLHNFSRLHNSRYK